MATVDPAARQQMDELLANLVQRGYGNLVAMIKQIWQGERDEEKLFDGLDREDSMIIFAILEGINNPDSLQRFLG